MLRFVIRRILFAVLVLLITTLVAFLIFFGLPKLAGVSTEALAARYAGREPTPDVLHGIIVQLGLDRPLPVQYLEFVKGLVAGRDYNGGSYSIHCAAPCFGYSWRTSTPVWELLLNRAPVTLSIAGGAAVLWLLGGVAAGVISALRKGTVFDRVAMTISLVGVSLPVFLTGLLALALFVNTLHLLPSDQYVDLTTDPLQWVENLILPWITTAFTYGALYTRLTRAGMLETMNEDYIRTARAKGLPERTVVLRHALRGTLTPIVSIFGMDLGLLLGGAVLTEVAFSMQGLGQLTIQGIQQSDLPVVLGVTLFAAFFIVVANTIVDIGYAVIDPRVRLA